MTDMRVGSLAITQKTPGLLQLAPLTFSSENVHILLLLLLVIIITIIISGACKAKCHYYFLANLTITISHMSSCFHINFGT